MEIESENEMKTENACDIEARRL